MVMIGIIGGSGLDDPKILKDAEDVIVDTPYGNTSSPIKQGKIKGVEVALIARHGRKHTILPTDVPNRANIYALKQIGCTHIIATTACGSLREYLKPGDFVMVDQFIDRTTKREQTFHEKGRVCHLPMDRPFCPILRKLAFDTANGLGITCHEKGTVITIEGPRFSTKAESHMFRDWGADVINMSTVPEAVLAREAGLCYAAVAMITDYDCWHESEVAVTIDMVIKTMKLNSKNMISLLTSMIPLIDENPACRCRTDVNTSYMEKN